VTADTPDPRPVSPPSELTDYGWWHPAACIDSHDADHNCLDADGSIIGWREPSAFTDPAALAAPQVDAGALREAIEALPGVKYAGRPRDPGVVERRAVLNALAASSPATAGREK